MKKVFLLFASAFFLMNCTNTKDSDKPEKKEKETTEKKETTKKADDKKDILDDHFEKKGTDDIKKEDQQGWPRERQDEVLQMCKGDMDDMEQSSAYCNCQLNNVMKIFASYKEAMTVFNKTESERTDSERRQIEMMENADENCMDQNDPDGRDDEDEDDRDKDDQ